MCTRFSDAAEKQSNTFLGKVRFGARDGRFGGKTLEKLKYVMLK